MKWYKFFVWSSVIVAIGTLISIAISQGWFLTAFTLGLFVVLLLILHRIYNLLNWIDPTVLFVVSYVTFIGVGIPFIGYYDFVLAPSVLFAILLGLAAFSAGAITFDALVFRPGRIKIRYSISIISVPRRGEIGWAWAFFVVGALILLYYYYRVGTVPLLAEDAENVRVTVKAGLGYLPILAFAFLTVSTMSIITLASTRFSFSCLLFAVVSSFIGTLLLMGTGYREPALRLLFNAFVVGMYIRHRKISPKWILVLGLFIILIIGLLGYLRLESHLTTELSMILRLGIWRLFVVNLYVLNLVYDLFPSSEPYMLGTSYLIDIETLLPGYQPHFGFWLKERLGLEFAGGGVTQTIIGELFLNWGWIGSIVGMFTMGIVFRILYHALVKDRPISAPRFVLLVMLSTSLMGMVSSGIVLVLLFNTLPLVAVFAVYQFCIRMTLSGPRENHVYAITTNSL